MSQTPTGSKPANTDAGQATSKWVIATAPSFGTSCKKQGAGYVATTPNGPPLFFQAEDGAALQTALSTVTKGVCCGCVH